MVEAGNGREALERLTPMPAVPELVLVDWNMPEMNGLDVPRQPCAADPAYDERADHDGHHRDRDWTRWRRR